MNKVKNIFVVFVILGLGGCATLPPPKPLDPQRAVIGIVAQYKKVYFVKLDEEEDLYTQGSFILSSYAKDGQVYLLNAKPGRYAAVAGTYLDGRGRKFSNFFPKELIKLTEVTVAPGTIEFMGEYLVSTSWWSWKDADDAQLHYFQLILPGRKTGPMGMYLSGESYFKVSLQEEHCDKQAELRFLTKALEQFKDTEWINIIQNRMEELKAEK